MTKTFYSKDYWDAYLYDGKHSFVARYGHDLIGLLKPSKGERVLDLGCGTGDLTKELFDLGVHVTGMDKSENMVKLAQKKYSDIPFIIQDVLRMEYVNHFDAVFSNATLHWVKSPKKALENIFFSLKKGGRFVAEFGGKGNCQRIITEIVRQLKSLEMEVHFPWYFPSIGEYATLMEDVGFRVIFAQHFDRPTPLEGEEGLANWIRMFGSEMLEGLSDDAKTSITQTVENKLRATLYQDGIWVADYKRIRVVGIKE